MSTRPLHPLCTAMVLTGANRPHVPIFGGLKIDKPTIPKRWAAGSVYFACITTCALMSRQ